jgi:DNA polymerase sigma
LIVHSKDGRQWKPEELQALMSVLREAFCHHRICTQDGIQILNGATVPIIKLTDRKTDVKVDMSFNMNNGLRSAQLILVCINQIKLRYVRTFYIIFFFFEYKERRYF